MPSAPVQAFLALPSFEQEVLCLLLVVHRPLYRSSMAQWLKAADLRDDKARLLGSAELTPLLTRWVDAGLLTRLGGPSSDTYTVEQDVGHELAALLSADGRLSPLATLVHKHEPLFDRFSYGVDAERLARELFLSLYLPAEEELVRELPRALALYKPRRDEHEGALYVRAFGLHAPYEACSRLPASYRDPYLTYALELSTRQLSRLSAGLLQCALEARGKSLIMAHAALYLTLRGELDAADALLVDSADAACAAARCFLALARGEPQLARQQGRAALELTRTKKGKLKGLSGSLWPWVVLALSTDSGAPEAIALAEEQLLLAQKKQPERHKLIWALSSIRQVFTLGWERDSIDTLMQMQDPREWTDLTAWLLLTRFASMRAPAPLLTRLEGQAERASTQGFVWLATELSDLASERASKLSSLHVAEEAWERSLRALEGAIQLADITPNAPEAVAEQRVAWTLTPERDGSFQLSARLQTRSGNGFTSGRQTSWKKLHELHHTTRALSQEDRRVSEHIRVVREFGVDTFPMAEDAPLALIGHPRVFLDPECRVPVEVTRGDVRVDVRQQGEQMMVTLVPASSLQRAVVVLAEGAARIAVYTLTPAQRVIAKQLSRDGLVLPPSAQPRAQGVLGKLVSHFALSSELALDDAQVEQVEPDARVHVQLRRSAGGLAVRLCVAPLGSTPLFFPGSGSENVLGVISRDGKSITVRCTRDLAKEQRALEHLLASCPALAQATPGDGEVRISELTRCLDLLLELRALNDEICIEWPDGQALSIVAERDLSHMKLKVEDQGSWLSAEGELPVDGELKLSFRSLLEHARAREGRYVALDDGRFVALSESLQRSLEGAASMSRGRGEAVELHPLALFGVTALSQSELSTDTRVEQRLARVREASERVPVLPATFEATLRPYQLEGFKFLSRLAHWGAGACLADDMGLGKTLQTLALLVEQAPSGPSLVVAPTSVANNWLEEARKFAPSLRFTQLGSGSRAQHVEQLAAFDVLVCSYGILQQEAELLASQRFAVVVLDEAQAIKNAATIRAKAAMKLVSSMRVALTGTPIENHLGELWSILSFVNPGLLGSAKSFDERFVKPIQRDQDRQASLLLRRLIAPFVLRRRKSEVLDDLPEKTVITLRVEPSAEERALFAALREQALLKMTDVGKPADARMRLLAELTRMRRAACHPDLIVPELSLTSSKLTMLETLLFELREGGHRALVFSQFVDYLTIVRERLSELGISYQYLDGSSSQNARAEAVRAFQAGESEVFLISLKAGGFGLNLTAADYVVHLDPWWNPAVEDQASDRAHRIGQTRPVTIYRLVMSGSIEEKILSLHASKRRLADDLLEGTASGPALGVDELMELLTLAPSVES